MLNRTLQSGAPNDELQRLRERLECAQQLVTVGSGPALKTVRRCFALTARESEVLRVLLAGKTNPEIAATLGCQPRTVGTHVESILHKTGAATRTAVLRRVLAVVLAAE